MAHTGLFGVAEFFADTPPDIESGQVAGSHWPHSHAKVIKSFIDGLDACAFFRQELGFTPIRAKHAVANESTAIADQYADLADLFGKLHASCDDLFAAGFATNNLQKSHDVGRAEEVRADDSLGPLGG